MIKFFGLRTLSISLVVIVMTFGALACDVGGATPAPPPEVPHQDRWGIYNMDLSTQAVDLIYSSPHAISTARLNSAGDRFVFSQEIGGLGYEFSEIFTVGADGQDLQRLTDNDVWDLYPSWSPDGTRIVFLSWRENDLDLYAMNADGSNIERLFDSGSHDADVHWAMNQIVFTSENRIWIVSDDGANARALTDPPQAGEWGNANLPYGDYDPRLSPDGNLIAFERMVDTGPQHGSYDLFIVDTDGTNLIQLTDSGYSQGFPSWSNDGTKIVYVVAAIEGAGHFDIYMMNADGSDNQSITPSWFPAGFICHSANFSTDDSSINFVGEWWAEE
jgi:TolB protein